MIDSPGHADFNNEVASALAVTDGVFLVVDVCEGIRVQTEATLKQAVTCGLGIALVLNKIDRLIIEQRLETSEASNRIRTIIDQVNALLLRLGSSTKLSFAQGNVIFGSAKFAWLASRTTLDALGLNKFGLKAIMAVYLACDDLNGDPAQLLKALESLPDSAFKKMVLAGAESLAKKNTDSILSHGAIIRATLGAAMPAADALLELARTALPSPRDSAPVKARLLMDEELHSAEIRTAVQNSDAKAPAIVLVAKLVALPGTSKQLCGLGRVFAGELSAETRLYEAGKESKKTHKILRLVRFGVREVSSCKRAGPGDVVGIVGLNDDLEAPATLTSTLDIAPFRQLNTSVTAKPVVRYAVMLKDQTKRNQLAKALAFLTKTDHAVKMAHTSEKETVIACASSLHASVCEARLNELVGSQSIELRCASVSLAETVTTRSTGPYDGGSCLAKTTNKLNRIYVAAQPLETLELGIELASCKSDKTAILAAAGWTKAKLRKVWAISDSGSLLIDGSSQIPHLAEFKDPAVAAFEQLTKSGPLSGSVVVGVMLIITDALIHAVAAQRRGPALQHAALRAMTAALLTAQPALLEPIYHMEIQLIPRDALRGILDTLRDRDATILDCQDSQIQALVPVVESLSTPNYPDDLTDALKAAARGRLQNPICRLEKWQLVRRRNSKRETELIDHTRNRLGLPRDIRTAESFMDRL
uniref:Tr-type G domain-containing protein n=1 Tax=Aureoumbra lagunensis TaxID=44058 RepID=A0A7S3JUG4_9STRA|mmetsp:Transcript_4500/g.5835  ORF Transcript_4500/g.5835 Transcript_4500/m.5835 type:complete len:703 (-) Transcript_4500:402-2510(-)